MATLRPKFLPPLASALLINATPALALQTIEARDGVSVEAAIALKEATRIKVDGANITEVFGNMLDVLTAQRARPLAGIHHTLRAVMLERFKIVVLSRPHSFHRRHFVFVHAFDPDHGLQIAGKCLHALLNGRAAQSGFLRDGQIGFAVEDSLQHLDRLGD